jgi:hypothetical protein
MNIDFGNHHKKGTKEEWRKTKRWTSCDYNIYIYMEYHKESPCVTSFI